MAGLQRKAGKRTKWLVFYKPAPPEGTQDSGGWPVDPNLKFAEAWGEVLPQSGRETNQARQVYADVSFIIETDHIPGLTPAHRCSLDGRRINLVEVIDLEERGKTHRLVGKEVV